MCRGVWFFFFQAEDGIRDYKVTGVQTCALPISRSAADRAADRRHSHSAQRPRRADRPGDHVAALPRREGERSEERRVGKEGRAGGSRQSRKKRVGTGKGSGKETNE